MDTMLGIGSRVKHPNYGAGVVVQVKAESYVITFIEHGTKEISRSYENLEVIDATRQSDDLVSFEEIEKILTRVLRQFADIQETVPISDKWRGGRMVFYPSNPDLKSYEMPIATFYHKIVMTRDRLRVMEQKVNASNLEEDEKIEIQQYISRIYGSLTSFNIFFKNKDDVFVGGK